MIRLYTPHFKLTAAESEVRLEAAQSHYLTSVMRVSLGRELCLFNGEDGEWLATVSEITKKSVTLRLIEQTVAQTLNQGPALLMALIKRARLETIVEKATELGVSEIRLIVTRRTQSDHTNIDRLTAIATEAAEQCGRLDVPAILAPQKLEPALKAFAGRVLFADEALACQGKSARPLDLDYSFHDKALAILIGPEGGFDEQERAALYAEPTVSSFSLGPRILRADTAAMAALVLYQAQVGDWV
jgi:16S rRNA (uracil1498-N3)-methyltransferase